MIEQKPWNCEPGIYGGQDYDSIAQWCDGDLSRKSILEIPYRAVSRYCIVQAPSARLSDQVGCEERWFLVQVLSIVRLTARRRWFEIETATCGDWSGSCSWKAWNWRKNRDWCWMVGAGAPMLTELVPWPAAWHGMRSGCGERFRYSHTSSIGLNIICNRTYSFRCLCLFQIVIKSNRSAQSSTGQAESISAHSDTMLIQRGVKIN